MSGIAHDHPRCLPHTIRDNFARCHPETAGGHEVPEDVEGPPDSWPVAGRTGHGIRVREDSPL